VIRQIRILVIDDHPAELFLMREAFRHAQWNALVEEIQSGKNAGTALERFRLEHNLPDLIIVDCLHQGETCLDTLITIRANPHFRLSMILVLASQVPTDAMIDACFQFEVLKVAEKPRRYSDLVKFLDMFKADLPELGLQSQQGKAVPERIMSSIADIPGMRMG
jgi:CheY-like chemotaxis protein